ncbi:MAG: outer membrane beta-barrel protein [Bacteroidia bacterium]
MKTSCTSILFLFLFTGSSVFSQNSEKRFRTILSAGIVGSQVDGDTYSGYNKSGLYGGVYVNTAFDQKNELEFGITYIQKGARKNANPNKGDLSFYLFRTNYIEVPLMYKINIKKFKLEMGLSYAYLFKYTEQNTYGYYNDKKLKNYDACYNLGAGYKISDDLYVNLRYNYSFLPIRSYSTLTGVYLGNFWSRIFNRGLYNNDVVLSINYILKPKQ